MPIGCSESELAQAERDFRADATTERLGVLWQHGKADRRRVLRAGDEPDLALGLDQTTVEEVHGRAPRNAPTKRFFG
ncbi:MAG: hypothetical protein ACFHWZ_01765 [Phycisphaerales bacterium]